jgi:hypothetical protein
VPGMDHGLIVAEGKFLDVSLQLLLLCPN